MSTWKTPERVVWHTLICSKCNKIISRARLPGLQRLTTYRVCEQCAAGAAANPATQSQRKGTSESELTPSS